MLGAAERLTMKIHDWTRNKVLIDGRLLFSGGYPKFRWTPKVVRWGKNISLFWLGTELVWIGA